MSEQILPALTDDPRPGDHVETGVREDSGTMKIESVRVLRAWDRDTGAALIVNDTVLATVNYEEHGSEGDGILVGVGEGLADMAGLQLVQEEVSDDNFRRIVWPD